MGFRYVPIPVVIIYPSDDSTLVVRSVYHEQITLG